MGEEEKQKIEVASKEEVAKVKEEIEGEIHGPAIGKTEGIPDSLIEQAKKVNEARQEILDREEKLQLRKEKLHADEMVAGKGQMTEDKKEETPKEFSQRIMKGELTEDERARGQI